jgi:hypothetical protein
VWCVRWWPKNDKSSVEKTTIDCQRNKARITKIKVFC